MAGNRTSYLRRIATALADLGIDEPQLASRNLKVFAEATRLAPVGVGTDHRDKFLAPAAAKAWNAMRSAAAGQSVRLLLVSAFRSVEFQTELIRGKLERGASIDDVLKVNAPPGYSEHHTGCAVDIGTDGCPPLEEAFENTASFAWLCQNAKSFGFSMSYPRGNPQGYLYEPWHWRFQR